MSCRSRRIWKRSCGRRSGGRARAAAAAAPGQAALRGEAAAARAAPEADGPPAKDRPRIACGLPNQSFANWTPGKGRAGAPGDGTGAQGGRRGDIEIFWDGMWIRRVGPHYFPDPDMFAVAEPNWERWAGMAEKYLRDAADYWFHVYQPQPGDTIVDIGAGRGEDVFAFSRAVGPAGTVWAIEPHPVSFGVLRKFCALNRLKNVTALNYACVDRPRSCRSRRCRSGSRITCARASHAGELSGGGPAVRRPVRASRVSSASISSR